MFPLGYCGCAGAPPEASTPGRGAIGSISIVEGGAIPWAAVGLYAPASRSVWRGPFCGALRRGGGWRRCQSSVSSCEKGSQPWACKRGWPPSPATVENAAVAMTNTLDVRNRRRLGRGLDPCQCRTFGSLDMRGSGPGMKWPAHCRGSETPGTGLETSFCGGSK